MSILSSSPFLSFLTLYSRNFRINLSSSNELKLLYLAIRGQRVQSWAKTMLQLTQSVTSVTSLPTPVRTMLSEIQTELAKVDMFINSATIA